MAQHPEVRCSLWLFVSPSLPCRGTRRQKATAKGYTEESDWGRSRVQTSPMVPTQSPRHLGKTHTWSSIRAASWAVCSSGVSVRVYFALVSFQAFRYLIWKPEARGKLTDVKKASYKQSSTSDLSQWLKICSSDRDCMRSVGRWKSFGNNIFVKGRFTTTAMYLRH